MFILIIDPELGEEGIQPLAAKGHFVILHRGEITVEALAKEVEEFHPDALYLNLTFIPRDWDINGFLKKHHVPRWFLYTGEASWKESGGWGFTAEELEERLFVPAAEG